MTAYGDAGDPYQFCVPQEGGKESKEDGGSKEYEAGNVKKGKTNSQLTIWTGHFI